MIKIEDVVTPSSEEMMFVIRGMRNPLNSWDRGDSRAVIDGDYVTVSGDIGTAPADDPDGFTLGKNDEDLMRRLASAGTEHRKFMRMMPVYVRITAPLYWWKEADTYKIGTVSNSCSTMHKITAKEFTLDDFSHEHLTFASRKLLERTIALLNDYRKLYLEYDGLSEEDKNNLKPAISCKKDIWWQLIQLLPSSYNQTRNLMLNYETLANIYNQRKNHKLDEWNILCKWIEELPYAWLITGEVKKMNGRLSIPDQKTLKALRKEYPMGTRIELVQMNDHAAPPVGTTGTVLGIDDLGSILVRWDNGSHLSVVFGVDVCKKISSASHKSIAQEAAAYVRADPLELNS